MLPVRCKAFDHRHIRTNNDSDSIQFFTHIFLQSFPFSAEKSLFLVCCSISVLRTFKNRIFDIEVLQVCGIDGEPALLLVGCSTSPPMPAPPLLQDRAAPLLEPKRASLLSLIEGDDSESEFDQDQSEVKIILS